MKRTLTMALTALVVAVGATGCSVGTLSQTMPDGAHTAQLMDAHAAYRQLCATATVADTATVWLGSFDTVADVVAAVGDDVAFSAVGDTYFLGHGC